MAQPTPKMGLAKRLYRNLHLTMRAQRAVYHTKDTHIPSVNETDTLVQSVKKLGQSSCIIV
jgi:hypothetical protein